MQGYDKKCESSQKRLVECKLFEKCKGAKEQQLFECNLFNHLPATSCQSSHNQLGGGGGSESAAGIFFQTQQSF